MEGKDGDVDVPLISDEDVAEAAPEDDGRVWHCDRCKCGYDKFKEALNCELTCTPCSDEDVIGGDESTA